MPKLVHLTEYNMETEHIGWIHLVFDSLLLSWQNHSGMWNWCCEDEHTKGIKPDLNRLFIS